MLDTVQKNIPVIFKTVETKSPVIETIGLLGNALSGKLTYNGLVMSNVKVSFLQDKNLQVDNEIVYDYYFTDAEGNYTAFLENGDYVMRVDAGRHFKYMNNIHITDGISEYFSISEDGQIKSRSYDSIEFHDTPLKLIHGFILNEYDKPEPNASILILANNELKTFIKTDKHGRFNFMLEYGLYEVHLRGSKQSVDIFNVDFHENTGFFTQHKNSLHLHEVTVDDISSLQQSDNKIYNRYFKSHLEEQWQNVKMPRFAKNITNTHRW